MPVCGLRNGCHGNRPGVALRLLDNTLDVGARPVRDSSWFEGESRCVVLIEPLDERLRGEHPTALRRLLQPRSLVHLVAEGGYLQAALACDLADIEPRPPMDGNLQTGRFGI